MSKLLVVYIRLKQNNRETSINSVLINFGTMDYFVSAKSLNFSPLTLTQLSTNILSINPSVPASVFLGNQCDITLAEKYI